MKFVRSVLCLILATGCVESRYSRKGELDEVIVINRSSENSAPVTKLRGTVATVNYVKTSCQKIKRTYKHEHYERRHYPAQSIALLGGLVAGIAGITYLSADHEGFLWPEGMPGIQIASGVTALVVGLGAIAAGWAPWFAKIPDWHELVSTTKDNAYDTVDDECSDERFYRSRSLPYTVRGAGQTLNGNTPSSGELELSSVARGLLTQGSMDEARFKSLSNARKVSLEVKLDDAPTVSTEVAMSCLNRDPTQPIFDCKVSCAEKGGAARCGPRLERCMERTENDKTQCTPMFDDCLAEKLEDKAAFESCRADCMKQNVLNACR